MGHTQLCGSTTTILYHIMSLADSAWFSESSYYNILLFACVMSFVAYVISNFIIAPYGKFGSSDFGIELDPRFGWWLMELMATVSFLFFFPLGPNASKPVPLLFAFLFLVHYGNRGWYFPLNLRVVPGTKVKFSFFVAFCGIVATTFHGYLNGLWYSKFCDFLDWNWFFSPQCLIGLTIYELSFWSTIYLEHIMRNLRDVNPTPGAPRYKIPRGFLFEYCTSAQYFTELTGFLGWMIMTKNRTNNQSSCEINVIRQFSDRIFVANMVAGGLYVFLISAANLVPRAIASQAWYKSKFEDYPKQRAILIPFVW